MNGYAPPPPFPPQAPPNGHRPSLGHRPSADFGQAGGNGPMPVSVPARPPAAGGAMGGNLGAFPAARSPPGGKSKDLSHVPCKFFRQGQCQAGRGCAYSHTFEKAPPCKYFLKGNCKFGLKCANEHILRDGTVANRPGYGPPPGNMSLGAMNGMNARRLGHGHGQSQSPSLLSMDQKYLNQPQPNAGRQQISNEDLNFNSSAAPSAGIPTIDTTFTSHPGSNYGSPPNERGALGMSPVLRGLSIADAQLPASFDSQGMSIYARQGPMAASVPSKFGFDQSSPPSSLPRNYQNEPSALHKLRSSAYADDSRSGATSSNGYHGFLGSSPPVAAEESISRRIMHSERYARNPKLGGMGGGGISSSLPGGRSIPIPSQRMGSKDEDWDDDLLFSGEDAVPKSLHEDILTPDEQEKSARRLSGRFGELDLGDGPGGLSHRHSLGALAAQQGAGSHGHGSPAGSTSNSLVGSPNAGSRFSALFSENNSRGPSAFGHVGSPLRNSSLQIPSSTGGATEAKRPRPVSIGSGLSVDSTSAFGGRSPPTRESVGVGMLSQQFQRTRLGSSTPGSETNSTASGAQNFVPQRPNIGTRLSGGDVALPQRLPSNSSNGALGKGRDRIDEELEEQEGVFDMEALEDVPASAENGARSRKGGLKRLSGGNGWGFFGSNRSAPKVELGDGGMGRA